MKIHASNLMIALDLAIVAQEEDETERGFTSHSAMLQGWIDLRMALAKGEHIQII